MDSNLGLFSAVTGLKRKPSSDALAGAAPLASGGLKRSFSSSVKRRSTVTSVSSTVASHQFVFTGTHGGGGTSTGMDGESSNWHALTRSSTVVQLDSDTRNHHSNGAAMSSHSTFASSSSSGGNSLFAKLGAHGGVLKKSGGRA